MTFEEFTRAVRQFCDSTNASITSWKRTAERNAEIGGVPGGPHVFWLAVDVVYDRAPLLAERLRIAHTLGLTLLDEGDHDHLQPKGWVNRVPQTARRDGRVRPS